ncbi:hypothetical protein E3G62_001807 [Mycobacteroides abscessus]|nr:hypothetical protein [Mycobacteroides abscessus]MBE5514163.1 hypothetical protein [Mycobacteroides abscessus]SLE67343.1 Uncharacterised protein [Mycobacteroides abscessus subsp. massiliense]SLG91869.1 Uncharacterised protein [Mycobacteroides abscessus subsp. massiliense]
MTNQGDVTATPDRLTELEAEPLKTIDHRVAR